MEMSDLSVGVDIESVRRFRDKPFDENKNFYERVFTKNEIDYCLKKADPYPSFAARWCVKEAVIKCVKVEMRDIEIVMKGGKPCVTVDGRKFEVSLSHTKDYAVGFAVKI